MAKENPYPGLFKTSAKLKSGERATYYYAWKNGPRLKHPFGSERFKAEFNAATKQRAKDGPPPVAPPNVASLIRRYEKSRNKSGTQKGYLALEEKSQKDYRRYLDEIEDEFGEMPLAAVEERGSREVFIEWRDEIAEDRPRSADYAMSVLSALFSFGVNLELLGRNPVLRPGRVYAGTRVETIWSVAQLEFFVDHAPARVARGVLLGGFSGQRQRDCLDIIWRRCGPDFLDVRQSKTDVHVKVPVWGPLAAMMNAIPAQGPDDTVLTTLEGQRWTSGGFRCEFRKARKAVVEAACALREAAVGKDAIKYADEMLAIADRRFSDLRGTAATMLRHAGCTIEEISAITGHKRADVSRILDRHYLKNDGSLAQSAALKLQNSFQNKLATLEAKLENR
ncbi:tyrosine-type recombinase/integrase [Rubrimonas cliftonensis]|uniref:Core-binding (CB) domain-containing protein n=1 Tax=Rubrimonas cliftonensis TaxID=89524 RepID=A0A1H3YZT5_9RHOB|nr:hypothetical protein [Rubrimonas cliftonensis]SEA16940.1 hypothetical protein SAMN05444370_103320 [Rubrimonas cliftonensis]